MRYGSNSGYRGMSFPAVLELIFIVLKLCGVIKWSWIWVLSPVWISWIIFIIILIWIKHS